MSDLDKDLYRSCKSSNWSGKTEDGRRQAFERVEGRTSLYPDYKGFTRKDGSVRAPDVTSFFDAQNVRWVRGVEDRDKDGRLSIDWKEGVSVSTKPGGFTYEGWFYFVLPEGTPVPAGLDVVPTPSRRDAGHHSIRCRTMMRQDAYEGALNNFARAAIARAVDLKRASLHFS